MRDDAVRKNCAQNSKIGGSGALVVPDRNLSHYDQYLNLKKSL